MPKHQRTWMDERHPVAPDKPRIERRTLAMWLLALALLNFVANVCQVLNVGIIGLVAILL